MKIHLQILHSTLIHFIMHIYMRDRFDSQVCAQINKQQIQKYLIYAQITHVFSEIHQVHVTHHQYM